MRANRQRESASPVQPPRGPGDEDVRLRELRRLGILDTPAEEAFDRVTRLAARTLGVPIVLVSFVDDTREWFKSRVGLNATQAPLAGSFAVQAVQARKALVVDDVRVDPRFKGNPFVNGAPYVEAYLGVPLCTRSGQPIGALCALDTSPRTFDVVDVSIWKDFAAIVEDTIHARELTMESDRLLNAAAESEQKHMQIEQRLQRIADSIPALIGYWNTDLICEFANDGYRAFFGFTPQQMIGMHFRELIGEKLFQLNSPHAYAALRGEAQRFQRKVVKADGSTAHTEGQYLPDRDEHGNVRGFFVLVTDVSELTQAKGDLEVSNAKLLKESTTDFLTGLANRRVFSERSEAAALRFQETRRGYSLILLDLDDFKQVNDRYGHDVGDDVLRAVGRVLAEQLRGRDDLAARLGGEEFAVLCGSELTEDAPHEMAGRIRAQLNKITVSTPKGPVSFTGSFGIATCNPEDVSWKSIFARADGALYAAKEAGKDRVVFGKEPVKATTGRFKAMGLQPGK